MKSSIKLTVGQTTLEGQLGGTTAPEIQTISETNLIGATSKETVLDYLNKNSVTIDSGKWKIVRVESAPEPIVPFNLMSLGHSWAEGRSEGTSGNANPETLYQIIDGVATEVTMDVVGSRNGSQYPALANRFKELTGRPVYFINKGASSTRIHSTDPNVNSLGTGGNMFDDAMNAVNQARAILQGSGDIDAIVMNLGVADAVYQTINQFVYEEFQLLIDKLKTQIPGVKIFLHLMPRTNWWSAQAALAGVMQQHIIDTNEDVFVASDVQIVSDGIPMSEFLYDGLHAKHVYSEQMGVIASESMVKAIEAERLKTSFIVTGVSEGTYGNATTPLTLDNLYEIPIIRETVSNKNPTKIKFKLKPIQVETVPTVGDTSFLYVERSTGLLKLWNGTVYQIYGGDVYDDTELAQRVTTNETNITNLGTNKQDTILFTPANDAEVVKSIDGVLPDANGNVVTNGGTGGSTVADSTTNGNLLVDGVELQVYDGSGKQDTIPYTTANDVEVIKTVSVNGGTPQTPTNGLVDLTVETGGSFVLTKDSIEQAMDYHLDPTINQFSWVTGSPQTFTLSKELVNEITISVNGQLLKNEQYTFTTPTELTINDPLESNDVIKVVYFRKYEAPITWEAETIAYLTALEVPEDDVVIHNTRTGKEIWDKLDTIIKASKIDGSWSTIVTWHPMLGGTRVKHGYNIVNTETHYMDYANIWVHNENGNINTFGSSNFAKMRENPITGFTQTNAGWSIASSSLNITDVAFLMGATEGGSDGSARRFGILIQDGLVKPEMNVGIGWPSIGAATSPMVVSTGMFGVREYSYLNGVQVRDEPQKYPDLTFGTTNPYYGSRVTSGTTASNASSSTLTSVMYHSGDNALLPIYHSMITEWETFLNRL